MDSPRHARVRHGVVALALACLAAVCIGPAPARGQSFVTFESGHVRPLALSPSRELLFAANTPDGRLEVFRVSAQGLERAGETAVGLEPVAVAARGESEVYVVNHLSDSVSVVDATDPSRPFVKATLLVGDEPRDVVIAGPSRDKVFIAAAHRGQQNPLDPQLSVPGIGRADIWVFAAGDLGAEPRVLTLFCDTPRALAVSPDGSRVFAAAFHSGNQTTVLNRLAADPDFELLIGDGFRAHGMAPPFANAEGVPAPKTGVLLKVIDGKWLDSLGRDWSPRVRFRLPDRDVFVIDASRDPPVEVGSIAHVGTVLFNMAVNPASGKLYVSSLESRNHVRLEPELSGRIAENRIAIVEGAVVNAIDLNPHLDRSVPASPPEDAARSLALPLDLVFAADGETLYVAAFGSGKVAVLDAEAVVQGLVAVGGGPSGLALDEGRGRLYVMNRFDHTISIVDTRLRREMEVIPLRYNPEPAPVRQGRRLLYDAANSGHGDAACASCHIFGDLDGLAWDLGDPAGAVAANPLDRVLVQGSSPLRAFHPLKGPMATQSLRGLLGGGPMHWRGDRNGVSSGAGANIFDEGEAFLHFRPAFQRLLGKPAELPLVEMEKLRDFILTLAYPPNPIARIDGAATEAQRRGKEVFDSLGRRLAGVGEGAGQCGDCHGLPLGTIGRGSFAGDSQDFKVPHLRNLYQKVGMFGYAVPEVAADSPVVRQETPTPHLGEQVRGFGFLHDGSLPTLADLFQATFAETSPDAGFAFDEPAGRSRDDMVRDLEAFLLAFPTGFAAAVGQQVTLDRANLRAALPRFELLRRQADFRSVELVVRGRAGGRERGFLYQRDARDYLADRKDERLSAAELLRLVDEGAVLTATAMYRGGGVRLALDRDEDGWFDLDEVERGGDPADPATVPGPPGERALLRGNCNGDERLDIADAVFSLQHLFATPEAPPCLEACEANGDGAYDISDPVYALNFLVSGGPPPGRYPHCERAVGDCADEACPGVG